MGNRSKYGINCWFEISGLVMQPQNIVYIKVNTSSWKHLIKLGKGSLIRNTDKNEHK